MRRSIAASASAVLAAALAAASPLALAAPQDFNFTVNRTTNFGDEDTTDNVCQVAAANGGGCSLRAAIEQINAYADGPQTLHSIAFSVTNVQLTGTGLPSVNYPTVIDGSSPGPRVEIDGNDVSGCFQLSSDESSGADPFLALPNFNNSRLQSLVIHNCTGDGVQLSGHGYVVYDSYIGVLPNGTTAGPNGGSGITVTAAAGENSIPPNVGDLLPEALDDLAAIVSFIVTALPNLAPNAIVDNVISGNDDSGVEMFGEFSAATILFDNKIGTNAAGTAAIPNNDDEAGTGYGVLITGSSYANFVAINNVIAGNDKPGSSGVQIDAGAVPFPNFVVANQIGVSLANPLVDLGNTRGGIVVGNTRPTTQDDVDGNPETIVNPFGLAAVIGPGNVVGYNGDENDVPALTDPNGDAAGILVADGNAIGVRIVGNLVGISENIVGALDIGNHGDGINVVGRSHQIGDDTFLFGNIIGSNDRHGLVVRGGSGGYDHVVKSNRIGTLPDALEGEDIGNTGHGLWLLASNVEVGGADFDTMRNVIAFNGRHGIKVSGSGGTFGNLIRKNAIFGVPTGFLGIDLDQTDDAPDDTDSDPVQDRDGSAVNSYANWQQNTVVLTAAAGGANWSLQSAPSTDYRIEFYANPDDARGGREFLCEVNATTDSGGLASGAACGGSVGEFLTAIVTDVDVPGAQPTPPGDDAGDPVNNSSEFSNGVQLPAEVRFAGATVTAGEGAGTATLTLERVGTAAVSADVAVTGGTAAGAGVDYSVATANPISWAQGETANKTVTINLVDDTLDEDGETVIFALENLTGGAVEGTPSQATLTITDDDTPPALSIGDVAQAEGSGGGTTAYTFTASLSAASGRTVTVTAASADGSATAGVDYTALPATVLTFSPGDAGETVTVQVAADTADEPDRTFFVNLSAPANATLADAQGLGTIEDDDLPAPTFSVSDAVAVTEGDSGTVNAVFTVTRAANTAGAATVQLSTVDGSATAADGDFAAQTNVLVSFGDGDATETVDVVVNGDEKFEPDEAFGVQIANPSTGSITDGTGAGAITDDDAQPTVAIDDVSLAEGDGPGNAAFTFTVSLSNPTSQAVSVTATAADDSATVADDDYVAISQVVNVAAGQLGASFTVNVVGDTDDEPAPQNFFVNLTAPTNATLGDAQGVGTIQNDDVPNTPSFAIDDVTVTEGGGATVNATFTVTRSVNTAGAATITATAVDGTATVADGDFAANAANLAFADGAATAQFTVVVNGDTKFEPNEQFTVQLSNASIGTIGDASGTGTIANDDAQPAIAAADVAADEGDGPGTTPFVFTVTLSNPSSQTVTVSAASADGSATLADGDYVQLPATALTFLPGDVSETVAVNVVGDTADEADQTFGLVLSGAVNGTIPGGSATATGTIANDDAPGVTNLAINDVSLAEGNGPGATPFQFTVTRTGDLSAASSVQATTADGTADAGDYAAVTAAVNFAAGESTRPVTVNVTGDTSDEVDQTFFVNLSNPSGATITDAQGQGTIVDDDDAAPGSVFAVNDVTQAEGNGAGTLTFTVSRAPSSAAAAVTVSTADGTAAAGVDYAAVPATVLNFAAAEATRTVVVNVLGNTTVEPDKTFTLNLSAPVSGSIGDGQGLATLLNDDLAPVTPTFDGSTPAGPVVATVTGGGPGCGFGAASQVLAAPPGAAPVPPTLPVPGAQFPYGLVASQITGCTPGATVTLTYTYPAALPAGTVFWKYGRELSNTALHWYAMPAILAGNVITVSYVDGGIGDDDLTVNGTIVDPAGPAFVLGGAPGEPVPVPALGRTALILLAALMLLGGGLARGSRHRAALRR